MASEAGPILAVIDCAADDAQVVAEAIWLARAAQTGVLLVHVARPGGRAQHAPSEQWVASEQRVLSELRVLGELQARAEQVRAAGLTAQVDDVYVGDASAQVAYAANRRRASAVVAARRPSRLAWTNLLARRSRDVRLARLLMVPLVLIDPAAVSADRRGLETAAHFGFELEPQPELDQRLVQPAEFELNPEPQPPLESDQRLVQPPAAPAASAADRRATRAA